MKLTLKMPFIAFCLFLLIFNISQGQVRITERVELGGKLKSHGRIIDTRYPMDAAVTFPETFYDFGAETGFVIGELSLYTPLNWGGFYTHILDTSSAGSLSISWNPKSESIYVVLLHFSTNLGHSPPAGDYPVHIRVDLLCGTVVDTTLSGFIDYTYVLQFPYPECTEPQSLPDLALYRQTSGFDGEEVCAHTSWFGVTSPSKMYSLQHTVCFDPDLMRWRYNIPQIGINYISDLCYDNINASGFSLINDVSEIPSSDICFAQEEILKHNPYDPAIESGDYFMNWVFNAHENANADLFEKVINDLSPDLYTLITNYNVSCGDAMTSDQAEAKWPDLETHIKSFYQSSVKVWNNILSTEGHEDNTAAQYPIQRSLILDWGELMKGDYSWIDCP